MTRSLQVVYSYGGAEGQQRMLRAHHMHYAYVPASELGEAGTWKRGQILDGSVIAGADESSGNETGGGVSFYAHERESCAISNLVLQAEQILPLWDNCGYMIVDGKAVP